jgi:hypothetical protein
MSIPKNKEKHNRKLEADSSKREINYNNIPIKKEKNK